MANDYQKNQGSIERQSTLKMVVDYCRMIGTPMTLKEIVDLLPELLQQVITELYDTEERIEHNSDSKYCQFC